MPRRRAPPRLYLDKKRDQWVIRDGAQFVRTGSPAADVAGAEKALREYLGQRHTPEPSPSPAIADVLNVYLTDHIPHTRAAKNATYQIAALAAWWGDWSVKDISAAACRDYAKHRGPHAGRRDLETLRAALNYWNKEKGPLASVPAIVLPDKAEAREEWLTKSDASKLLSAARHTPHLARFIIIGLRTGSRSGAILNLQWSWIDMERGLMRRRAHGETETKKKRPPVRIGAKLLFHLRRWKRMDGSKQKYVIHYDGQRVKKLRRSWSTACERAGLEDVTPHTLRHTRATWLMQAGVDPWEAAGHLGMSVETLQRVYGKQHPDYQKNAAEV